MKAKIEIKMDNAAFGAEPRLDEAAYFELAHILEELAMRVRFCKDYIPIADSNGNTVGRLEVSHD